MFDNKGVVKYYDGDMYNYVNWFKVSMTDLVMSKQKARPRLL